MINQDEDMKIFFECNAAHQLLLGLSLNNIAPNHDLNMLVLLSITKWLLWLPGMTLINFANSSFDSFFAPSWSEYCLFSFLGSTGLPPGGQLFKECREMLMSFLSRILQIRLMFLFDNLSCSGIKSYISKIMFIQSLVVEMKSERYQFWKRSFENQASSIKDPTHVIQNMQSFDCPVFWKQKWFVVRLKWLFSWFFVSVLTFDLGYLIWWFAMRWPSVNFKKQKAQVKTWGFIKKWLLSFFSTNFISMHNNK